MIRVLRPFPHTSIDEWLMSDYWLIEYIFLKKCREWRKYLESYDLEKEIQNDSPQLKKLVRTIGIPPEKRRTVSSPLYPIATTFFVNYCIYIEIYVCRICVCEKIVNTSLFFFFSQLWYKLSGAEGKGAVSTRLYRDLVEVTLKQSFETAAIHEVLRDVAR